MVKIKSFFTKDRLIVWVKDPIFWLVITATILGIVLVAKAPFWGGIAIGAGAGAVVTKVIKK